MFTEAVRRCVPQIILVHNHRPVIQRRHLMT